MYIYNMYMSKVRVTLRKSVCLSDILSLASFKLDSNVKRSSSSLPVLALSPLTVITIVTIVILFSLATFRSIDYPINSIDSI